MRVDGPYGPRFDGPIGPRVLRFDTACGCEGVVSPAAIIIKAALRAPLPAFIVILRRRRRISVHGVIDSYQLTSPLSPSTPKTPCSSRRGIPKALREGSKFIYDVQPAEEKHSLLPAILHSMDTRRQDVRPFSGSLLLCIHSQEEGKFIS